LTKRFVPAGVVV